MEVEEAVCVGDPLEPVVAVLEANSVTSTHKFIMLDVLIGNNIEASRLVFIAFRGVREV